jgi:hypothetical protein
MSDIELIITRCKTIETLLVERWGANGRGLHEKISSVENLLPSHIVKQGRYIATIRNKMMHDARYQNLDDRNRFIQICNEVETALRSDRSNYNSAYNYQKSSPSKNFTEISVDLNSYFGTTGERLQVPRNFIFYLEKNKLGIKLATRPIRLIVVIIQKIIPALLLFIVCELAFIVATQKIATLTHLAIGSLIIAIAIIFYTFFQIQDFLIKTTITPTHLYVGRRKYERRREIIFYIFSNDINQTFSWQGLSSTYEDK